MVIANEEQLSSGVLTDFPSVQRILVIAPHPDDEVFGCGGTLARLGVEGVCIVTIIVTDGALGGAQGADHAEDCLSDMSAIRVGESCAAAQVLGLDAPVFWGLPDRGVLYGEVLVERLMAAIREHRAALVLLPSPADWHPDHQALAFAGAEAVRRLGAEHEACGLQAVFYEVTDPLPNPNLVCNISAVEALKAEAMQCFGSQLQEQPYADRIAGINRFRAMHLGATVASAEAFMRVTAAELDQGLARLLESSLTQRRVQGYAAGGEDLPLVSVIVRSMDRPTLDKSLDSVALQTWPNIEVVLVNAKGASHRVMPEAWGQRSLRFVDQGGALSRTRAANLGLDAARGEYLMFLDDDDWFDADHVAKLVKALQQNPHVGLAYTGVRLVDTEGNFSQETLAYAYDEARLLAGNLIPIHAALFSRDLRDGGCRFDENFELYEDWDFWLQVTRLTPFLFVDGVSAIYRIDRRAGSGVHADGALTRDATLAVFRKQQPLLTDDQCLAMMQAIQQNHGRGGQIARLEAQLAERIEASNALTSALGEQSTQIADLEGQMVERDAHWAALAAQSHDELQVLKLRLAECDMNMVRQREVQAHTQLQVHFLERSLAQSRAEMTRFLNSHSFRLTRPLRDARRRVQQVRHVVGLAQRWLERRGGLRRGLPRLVARSWEVLARGGVRGFVGRLRDFARFSDQSGELDGALLRPRRMASLSAVGAVLPDTPRVDYRFWQNFPLPCDVDVIVCVHNALEDVRRCLSSVVRYSVRCRLIIVDDGSRDDTRDYLQTFAHEQGATLIRNEVARGYTFAANQGLRAATGGYVVLLNSDTIVTLGWVEKLVACAESDPAIGLVGPLSNTASWQSIPEIEEDGDWAINALPSGVTIADMGSLIARHASHGYPRMSFLNGFCLMLRRAVMDEIGIFDEAAFGRGYGEENDYCLRARKAGWELALADNAYVFHAQSKSYSHEKRKLLAEQAGQHLAAKHGGALITAGVAQCRWDRQLISIRAHARVMLEREALLAEGRTRWEGRRVLFVLPIMQACGGSNVVITEASAMLRMGVTVVIANLSLHRSIFEQSYPALDVPVIYFDTPGEIATLGKDFDAVVATAFNSVDWLMPLATSSQVVLGYYVQDFEPLFFPPGSHNHEQAMRSYTQIPGMRVFTKTAWNCDEVLRQTGVVAEIVGPSYDCDLFRPRLSPAVDENRPVKVVAMVRPSTSRRNPEGTIMLLARLQQRFGERIEIVIFGAEEGEGIPLPNGIDAPRLINHGLVRPGQMANLLSTTDLFIDMSHFQAMGLTAMEAMACGAVVIVPRAGGSASFAEDEVNALLIDTTQIDEAVAAAARLIEDVEKRRALQLQGMNDIARFFPEKSASAILQCLLPQRSLS
ncbi:MAG: glycosyltransferase [Sterolibacterium sp.]|nr:glycosyltransferase [Sterolibacterium sp.]